MDGFDECGDLCEIDGRSGILAARIIADAAGELEGIVSVGPCVGKAGLLQQAGMLMQAGFERVEIFKEPVDGVIPPSGCFTFNDRHHPLGRGERAIGRIEILVREHQHRFSIPVAAACDAEEVVSADAGLAPTRLEDGLCRNKVGGDVGSTEGCRIDGTGEGNLQGCRHN